MSRVDMFCEKAHREHDPRWSGRAALPAGGAAAFCVACLLETLGGARASSVRKSVTLLGVSEVLRGCPGALKEVLVQDHRVSLHLVSSLLGMLRTQEEPSTLERVIQVLVHLLLELQSEQCVQYVLEEVHAQLSARPDLRESLPAFNFLGNLLDAMPTLSQALVAHHAPLLEQLSAALLLPDEALKASVCYVFHRVWARGGASKTLPPVLKDRVCVQVLHTLHRACSPQLIVNCLGFLKEALKLGDAVSLLMNPPMEQEPQLSPESCCLPLVLKKLLLSGDESLQVASAQCIAAVLVHSPSQYCSAFIQADIPEFLCERLCSRSEVLLWSVYSCLLLMTEDPLFFAQCHSVYGIEPLVRSLKEALTLTSVEVQKQGLMLLTEILDRQPVRLGLFPSAVVFAGAVEVVLEGISSPCLQVATQAGAAATALLRLNHQSSPVQYRELKKLVEIVMDRCTELPLPSAASRRASWKQTGPEARGQTFRAGAFLLQALACFQAACRLAEQCAGVPGMEENAFTAPDRPTEDNTLGSFCHHLLRCCDTACIPIVIRHCERAPSASLLQRLFDILCSQFSLLPAMMPLFCAKLASSGFFGFTLKHKAAFCAGNRNPALNLACADFLQRLSACLLAQLEGAGAPPDSEEVLRRCLPSLCCRPSDWSSLLREGSLGPKAMQYGLLILLYLALRHEDRLLPDPAVFSCTLSVLCSVQEQGGEPPPPCVLRAGLYLLSVTQDGSPELALAPLHCLRKALSSAPGLRPLYIHSLALLHFIFRYPELAEQFGASALELWLMHDGCGPAGEGPGPDRDCVCDDITVLLPLMEEKPAAVLTLLGLVCRGESPLAHRALRALGRFLRGQRQCDTAALDLRPRLLQVLQRLAVEHSQAELGAQDSLTLVLQLLCLALSSDGAAADMDGTDFKLLFHVSNLAAKLKPSDTQPLLLALNYLYCSLSLSPEHCTDKVVSMLLCNAALLEQLQMALSSSSSSLLCSARLLLSSLLTQCNSAQVQKRISLNLDEIVQLLTLRKSQTDSLLLVCSIRLLQTLLDQDLQCSLLFLTAETFERRPLLETEAALQPLGSHRARCLLTALQGLLLHKQEFLLSASVSCLASLLGFLHRRSPTIALHMVFQPWGRFLLFSVLASGGSYLLSPAILALLSLMVHLGGESVLGETGLAQLLSVAERRGVKELGGRTAEALKRLLTQLQVGDSCGPCGEHAQRVQALLDSLSSAPPPEARRLRILRAGELSLCWGDLAASG